MSKMMAMLGRKRFTGLWIAATAAIAVVAAGLAGPAAAQYMPRRGPPALVGPPPPLDAAGCYFYRGRQRCGRYCYYEVNGKRYCQRRERDAVPQAPFDWYPVEPDFGLK